MTEHSQQSKARPKAYLGRRDEGEPEVLVSRGGTRKELVPPPSQRVSGARSVGFGWGTDESGTGELALALLFDFTHDRDLAERLQEAFRREVIAHLPTAGWRLTRAELEEWLADQAGREPVD